MDILGFETQGFDQACFYNCTQHTESLDQRFGLVYRFSRSNSGTFTAQAQLAIAIASNHLFGQRMMTAVAGLKHELMKFGCSVARISFEVDCCSSEPSICL
jgi:hypothetical protein